MKTQQKIKSITIIGRRWFQSTYGNTYFSSEIYVNGELVHRIDFEYGYGSMYKQSAFEWLQENEFISLERRTQPSWQYCQDNNIELIDSVTDVQRKKDL